eukprot:854485_1
MRIWIVFQNTNTAGRRMWLKRYIIRKYLMYCLIYLHMTSVHSLKMVTFFACYGSSNLSVCVSCFVIWGLNPRHSTTQNQNQKKDICLLDCYMHQSDRILRTVMNGLHYILRTNIPDSTQSLFDITQSDRVTLTKLRTIDKCFAIATHVMLNQANTNNHELQNIIINGLNGLRSLWDAYHLSDKPHKRAVYAALCRGMRKMMNFIPHKQMERKEQTAGMQQRRKQRQRDKTAQLQDTFTKQDPNHIRIEPVLPVHAPAAKSRTLLNECGGIYDRNNYILKQQSNFRAEAPAFTYSPTKSNTNRISEPEATSTLSAHAVEFLPWIDTPLLNVDAIEFNPNRTPLLNAGAVELIPFHKNNPNLWMADSVTRDPSLSDDIKSFYVTHNQISVSQRKMKEETFEMIKAVNNAWNVFIFGSESWNIRGADSDIDIGIQLPFATRREGKIAALKECMKYIKKVCVHNEQFECIPRLHATYPIFTIKIEQYRYDISISDEYCLKTKKIIGDALDGFENNFKIPIRELIVFIKYWSKQRRINNAFKCYLNSFGFTILTLHYLRSVTNDTLHKAYQTDLCYLVCGFFNFYVKILKADGMHGSIRNDGQFHEKRNDKCIMEIIDPANPKNNVAKNVGYKEYTRIRKEVYLSDELCKSHTCMSHQSLFQKLTG